MGNLTRTEKLDLKAIAKTIVKQVEDYCQSHNWKPSVYVGKTNEPKERVEYEHRENKEPKTFYLTVVAESSTSEIITKLREEVIAAFKKSGKLNVIPEYHDIHEIFRYNQEESANKLYVTFSEYLPDDELGEFTVEIEKLPINLD